MKLVTFINLENQERLGVIENDIIYDLSLAGNEIVVEMPHNILSFLKQLPNSVTVAKNIVDAIRAGKVKTVGNQSDFKIVAPVPHPPSCRDGYAFRQHVASARKNRGLEMIAEFDEYPIFYFTNHNAMIGPGQLVVQQDQLQQLDFELEVAIVIGKKCRNVTSAEADDCIFGYTIMNDFSARLLQMEEMKLNLGPAKGKDFATAIGPWLVTKDELEPYKIKTPYGDKYDLKMQAFHNGTLISEGNLKDMNWTFAEIVERASYGVDLYPGDVIGSGTVGTGCYLELNGTRARLAKEQGSSYTPVWLKDQDTMELKVDGLGSLMHKIVASTEGESILKKKKTPQ